MNETKTKFILISWAITVAILTCANIYATAGLFGNLQKPSPFAAAKADDGTSPRVLGAFTEVRMRADDERTPMPVQVSEPDILTIKSKSFLAYDAASGRTLVQHNATSTQSVASLTKLLTGLVVYNNTYLEDRAAIAENDTISQMPSLKLRPGDIVAVRDLFNAMIVGSANDAAKTLANFVESASGRIFIELMNEEAAYLGMSGSHFSNPLGFDSRKNYSTAEDIAKLVKATQEIKEFTDLGKLQSLEFASLTGRRYRIVSTNKLLKTHPEITAVKTGNTPEAGEAMVSKAEIGGHSVVLIILNSPDREGDTLALKNAIEKSFQWAQPALR